MCRTGVSDRAVWHVAATMRCNLQSATQLQCRSACCRFERSANEDDALVWCEEIPAVPNNISPYRGRFGLAVSVSDCDVRDLLATPVYPLKKKPKW